MTIPLYWTSYGLDGAGNNTQAFLPKGWKGNGTRAGVVYCHGDGGAYAEGTPGADAGLAALVQAVVEAGYPIITSDMGGAHTWGNSAAQTAISDAWTLLQNLGCSTSKVGLWGQSMGHSAAMNWAANNPSKVACVLATFPVSSMASLYDEGGYGAEIDTAYSARTDASCGTTSGSPTVTDTAITAGDQGKRVTGTGIPTDTYVGTVTAGTSFLLSSSPIVQVNVNATATGTVSLDVTYPAKTNDPTWLAQQSKYSGLPWLGFYGSIDTTVLPATVTNLISLIGATATGVGVNSNHTYPNQSLVSLSQIVAFLGAHL